MNTSIKIKAKYILNSSPFFISIALICLLMSIKWGSAGYLFGIVAVLITAWANNWDWKYFDLKKSNYKKEIILALIIAIIIFLVFDVIIQPLLESRFEKVDLSNFDGLRGNLGNFLIFSVVMWITAAIGEEVFYRAYLMKRIAVFLGDQGWSWLVAAVINGIYFGLAHLYQGYTGVFLTGFIGFILGLIFAKSRSLVLLILIHGFYDMIGITLIYLNKDQLFSEFFNKLMSSFL